MLAELAAANAAFEVVKQTVQNGREIYEAGEALAKYFGLKTEIQKKAHQHGYKSDLQAFMAEEQLAAREAELKEMMIYLGRAGMWDDWLKFQSDIKRSREEEERNIRLTRLARKRSILNGILYTSYVIAGIVLFTSVVFITLAVVRLS